MRVLLAALLTALLVPSSAFGHAALRGTVPERGATVAAQPAEVQFRFSEPVEAAFGAVRVFDANARRVDDGTLSRPRGAASIAAGLRPGLPDGTYTATYRVVSADGHPVSGGLVFSVGEPGAGPAKSVGELLGATTAGTATRAALDVARGLSYVALAVLLGGPALLLRGGLAVDGGARRWLLGGALLGVLACLGMLVGQGAVAGATSWWKALEPDVLREVLDTRFGLVAALEGAGFAVLAAALAVRAPARLVLAGAALLCAAPPFLGHPATQSPRGLLVALDTVHVAAMALWLGGLATLLAVVPRATRALPAPERTPLLARVLLRFSPVALVSVLALLTTGTVQAVVHLASLDDLWETGFGRFVLLKAGLLAVSAGIGALHRRRTIPRLQALAAGSAPPGSAGRTLRTALRAEVALIVVVLGLTSVLVTTTPPATASAGPQSIERPIGPYDVTLTVDPAQPGRNELHLHLLDRDDGAPFDGADEVTLTASLASAQIGPLDATLRKAGPGHFVADALTLAPGGTWTLRLTVRVGEFDQYETTTTVRVR